MRLVASVIAAPLEVDRYLLPCVESLAAFCDGVRVWADGSPELVADALRSLPVSVRGTSEPGFMAHEGRARQRAYEWALQAEPTHVLAVDADEFVSDGAALRKACAGRDVVALCMQEVWAADEGTLSFRMDGGWAPHPVPVVFAPKPGFSIPDKAQASGRVPLGAVAGWRQRDFCAAEILHFGWANEAERAARYARYANQGNFGHAARHVESIMWPDERIRLCRDGWPPCLEPVKTRVLEAARGGV